MRNIYFIFSLCLALFVLPSLSYAESKIVVVDVQQLLKISDAAKSIRQQFEDKRGVLEKEFSGFEDNLRSKQKELIENRKTLPQEEFDKKRQVFEKELAQTSGVVSKKKRNLEVAVAKATAKLRAEIVKIVADISETKGYSLVLTRDEIVLVEKSMDITQEVMKTLNSKIKAIALDVNGS